MHTKYGVHSTPIWCTQHINLSVLGTPKVVCTAHFIWCASLNDAGTPNFLEYTVITYNTGAF